MADESLTVGVRLMIRVMTATSGRLFSDALEVLLDAEADLEVVATVSTLVESSIESIDALLDECEPDVAIIDVEHGDLHAFGLARQIAAMRSQCSVVIVSRYRSDRIIASTYAARAAALIGAETPCRSLLETVRDVAAGIRLVTAEDARAAQLRVDRRGNTLEQGVSSDERNLMLLVRRGLTDAQIADHLHLSAQTVRNRVSRLLRRLGLTNRVQLAVLAATTLPDDADLSELVTSVPHIR
jgi:DNA-binding NarL/FixJ family response regulator